MYLGHNGKPVNDKISNLLLHGVQCCQIFVVDTKNFTNRKAFSTLISLSHTHGHTNSDLDGYVFLFNHLHYVSMSIYISYVTSSLWKYFCSSLIIVTANTNGALALRDLHLLP